MRALFTLGVFLGSFLLFLVQPMVAKMILPTFGGSPQVWNASLVFFQASLLLGYGYAHLSVKWLGLQRQPLLHLGLLALAALLLPFSLFGGFGLVQDAAAGVPNALSPLTDLPAALVFVGLAIIVGLPFVLVSAGAPILQRWFADTSDPRANDPYFLYAASNVGSLMGLFAYPFLLEPRSALGAQARAWAFGYGALILAVAACAAVMGYRRASPRTEAEEVGTEITWLQRGKWVLLAAVPSSLLLGVTTYLTTNLAPIPLLWIVPLALYLMTFVFAFSALGVRPVPFLSRLLPLLATPLAIAIVLESSEPIIPLGLMHLTTFFVAAWMCHARLSGSRPAAARLTEFYVWVAVGGVLGGAFNALLAPVAFRSLWEYPIALVAACLLRPAKQSSLRDLDWLYPGGVAIVAMGTLALLRYGVVASLASRTDLGYGTLRIALVLGIPLIVAFFAVDRPIRFALSLGAVFLVALAGNVSSDGRTLATDRSFFGVHRVVEMRGQMVSLVHGNTIHGLQDRKNPRTPLTYYHPTGPIGQVFRQLEMNGEVPKVALVGLGVGSLAAYGQPGQQMTFYEIDPLVVDLARDRGFFTFLKDSRAAIKIVLGDARLTLGKSDDRYGAIVLDAFTSDAIPVHLLTREAIAMYVSKLAPHGVLAFHISNRYLDLSDVLAATASSLGLVNRYMEDGMTSDEEEAGKNASKWMLLAKSEADLDRLAKDPSWETHVVQRQLRPWTDDFSNILGAWSPDQ